MKNDAISSISVCTADRTVMEILTKYECKRRFNTINSYSYFYFIYTFLTAFTNLQNKHKFIEIWTGQQ